MPGPQADEASAPADVGQEAEPFRAGGHGRGEIIEPGLECEEAPRRRPVAPTRPGKPRDNRSGRAHGAHEPGHRRASLRHVTAGRVATADERVGERHRCPASIHGPGGVHAEDGVRPKRHAPLPGPEHPGPDIGGDAVVGAHGHGNAGWQPEGSGRPGASAASLDSGGRICGSRAWATPKRSGRGGHARHPAAAGSVPVTPVNRSAT